MKKEYSLPLILAVLGLLFITINIILFFSKANKKLIRYKLKTGAMILSITALASCGSPKEPAPTCYSEAVNDYDSLANIKKQDSLAGIEKQKRIDDSIQASLEEQRIKDSILKKKKPPVVNPTCYKPVQKTCYVKVKQ